jgi:hypothetical protein
MKTRAMNPASLENLKLGAVTRNKGKIKCSITILPETKAWLERNGNVSGRIDEMVGKILSGDLVGRRSLDEALNKIEVLTAKLKALKTGVGHDSTSPTAATRQSPDN